MAGRFVPRAGADHGDRSRGEHFVEAIDRHPLSELPGHPLTII
jgi:hypothetical protein